MWTDFIRFKSPPSVTWKFGSKHHSSSKGRGKSWTSPPTKSINLSNVLFKYIFINKTVLTDKCLNLSYYAIKVGACSSHLRLQQYLMVVMQILWTTLYCHYWFVFDYKSWIKSSCMSGHLKTKCMLFTIFQWISGLLNVIQCFKYDCLYDKSLNLDFCIFQIIFFEV